MSRQIERLRYWVVWHLPRWLVYTCGVRLFAEASTTRYAGRLAGEITLKDALFSWDNPWKEAEGE